MHTFSMAHKTSRKRSEPSAGPTSPQHLKQRYRICNLTGPSPSLDKPHLRAIFLISLNCTDGLKYVILLLLSLLLREPLFTHLVDPPQFMRHDRADTPRVVIVVISPPNPQIIFLVPLPTHGIPSSHFMPGRRTRFLHKLPQHSNFTLDDIMLREDAFKRTYLVDEGCLGVVQLGLGTGAMGGVDGSCCS